jgi:peroxiredoxin Q/BCP
MNIKINDKAPEFHLQDQNENWISNVSLLGTKYVLFFYGQDDTPTCTKQVCAANSVFDEVQKAGYEIFGISPDKPKKHLKFKNKYNLKIQLLSDPDKQVMHNFEAYGPKIFMGKEVVGVYRKTYFIDELGKITGIIPEVVAANQGEQILEELEKISIKK